MNKTENRPAVLPDDSVLPLCPVCGRELDSSVTKANGGWDCRCGEFIPESLTINPFEGCTCGLSCNCGREMRR